MSEWLKIDTAPKTGDVLVYCQDTKEQMVAFLHKSGRWQFAFDELSGAHVCDPTHWMPLPEPPK